MKHASPRNSKLFVFALCSFVAGLTLSACDQDVQIPEQNGGSSEVEAVAEAEIDDQPQGANALGALALTMPELFAHDVSLHDRTDFFRFKVPSYGQTRLHLEKEHNAALFLIVSQLNAQGGKGPAVIDFWQEDQSADHNVILPEGEYLLEVKNRSEDFIPYALGMSLAPGQGQEPEPEPGDRLEESLDLGVIGDTDLHLAGYVGIVDPVDYYRVQVPANKQLRVQGASEDGSFDVSLVQLQGDEEVVVSELDVPARSGVLERLQDAQAGVYFIKVESRHRPGAMYQVTLGLEAR